MNFKKFTLYSLFFAITVFNTYATTNIIQVNEELLVEALCKQELSINSIVFYNNNIYTITSFEKQEKIDFYDVLITLQGQFTYLGIVWGDEYVKIQVTKEFDTSKTNRVRVIRQIKFNNKSRFVGVTFCFAIFELIGKLL